MHIIYYSLALFVFGCTFFLLGSFRPNSLIQSVAENCTVFTDTYLNLVEMAVSGSLMDEAGACVAGKFPCDGCHTVPYNPTLRQRGNDWPVVGHTMVGHLRLQNIRSTLSAAILNKVPGDFVELGVWRGGAAIYARAVLNAYGQYARKVHIFDAFEEIPGYGAHAGYIAVSEDSVRHNFAKYGLLQNVRFYKGLFKDSVPAFRKVNSNISISVLRIDGNFFDAYYIPLYHLFDLVEIGGFVIFDDVLSHAGAMSAWTNFKKEQELHENINKIDDHSAYFEKKHLKKVEWSKYKLP